ATSGSRSPTCPRSASVANTPAQARTSSIVPQGGMSPTEDHSSTGGRSSGSGGSSPSSGSRSASSSGGSPSGGSVIPRRIAASPLAAHRAETPAAAPKGGRKRTASDARGRPWSADHRHPRAHHVPRLTQPHHVDAGGQVVERDLVPARPGGAALAREHLTAGHVIRREPRRAVVGEAEAHRQRAGERARR